MKVLITGGAGFVGANLALYLKNSGYEVIIMDNLVRRGSEFNIDLFKTNNIKFVHGDVRNNEDFLQLPKVDIICECSAQSGSIEGYKNPAFTINNNTSGTLNVLEFARKYNAAVIYWSTNKVYSSDIVNNIPVIESDNRYKWFIEDIKLINKIKGYNPSYGFSSELAVDGSQHSIYGLSKLMGDLMCQEYHDAFGVQTVCNRFSCIYGERQWGKCDQGWVMWFAVAQSLGLPITYDGWKGKQVRDILYIEDMCELIRLEIENINKIAGRRFNIGGGIPNTISLIECTKLFERMTQKKTNVTVLDHPRKADHCVYISDIRAIYNTIGWYPKVMVEDGFVNILRWIDDNKNIVEKLYK